MVQKMCYFQHFVCITLLLHMVPGVFGHGRLIEPPSRSSAFRFGFNTPPNDNDRQLNCGGAWVIIFKFCDSLFTTIHNYSNWRQNRTETRGFSLKPPLLEKMFYLKITFIESPFHLHTIKIQICITLNLCLLKLNKMKSQHKGLYS